MKVFLANPPWRTEKKIGHRAGARFPTLDETIGGKHIFIPFPFFLAYATSVLKQNGVNVFLRDSVAEEETYEAFYKKVEEFKPDLFLIETSTPSIFNDTKVAKTVKGMTGCKIAFSGPHMFSLGVQTLKENDFIDYGLFGEYEYTVLDLVNQLEKGGMLKNVRGLIFRNNGRIIKNREREVIKNLDELPWPAYEFLPMLNYYGINGLRTPQVQMITSRGCPYRCIFCVFPRTIYLKTYRMRDSVKVADEMEWLIKKYKFKAVYFFDDTFNIGKKRILKLCEEIKRRDLGIIWGAQMRPDITDMETLVAMKESGFRAALFGVESGSLKIQKTVKKDLDLNDVRRTMEWFNKLSLKAHLTFTIGLPGETKETIRDTLEFAKEVNPYSAQFSITTPFPGTEYFEWLEKKGFLITKDWSKYDARCNPVLRTDALTADELREEFKKLNNEWFRFIFFRKINRNKVEYIKQAIKNPARVTAALKKLASSYISRNVD